MKVQGLYPFLSVLIFFQVFATSMGHAESLCQDIFQDRVQENQTLRSGLDHSNQNQSFASLLQMTKLSFRKWIKETFLLDAQQKHQQIFNERRNRFLSEQQHLQKVLIQKFGQDWILESKIFAEDLFQSAKKNEPRFFNDEEVILLQGASLDNTLEFQFLSMSIKDLNYKIRETQRQIQSLSDSENYLSHKKKSTQANILELNRLQKKREDLELQQKSYKQQLKQDELLLERIKPLREQLFVIAKSYDSLNPSLHLLFILNKSMDDLVFDSRGKMIPKILLQTLHW